MTLADKLQRLVINAGYGDIPFQPFKQGYREDFVIWSHNDTLYVIMEQRDYNLFKEIREFLTANTEFEELQIGLISPPELLSLIITGFLYSEISDQHTFAITPTYTSRGFMGFGEEKPDYKKIRHVLEQSGFLNVPD